METIIDLIFWGTKPVVNFIYLNDMMDGSREIRLNSSEENMSNYDDFNKIVDKTEFIDLVINTDRFMINQVSIPKTFINLTIDGINVELLIYFDHSDLHKDPAVALNYLMLWCSEFTNRFGFNKMACRIDNGTEDEYFFDSTGIGPLFKTVGNS